MLELTIYGENAPEKEIKNLLTSEVGRKFHFLIAAAVHSNRHKTTTYTIFVSYFFNMAPKTLLAFMFPNKMKFPKFLFKKAISFR
jgi:hypothetical protein